jgi:hypothetical protein
VNTCFETVLYKHRQLSLHGSELVAVLCSIQSRDLPLLYDNQQSIFPGMAQKRQVLAAVYGIKGNSTYRMRRRETDSRNIVSQSPVCRSTLKISALYFQDRTSTYFYVLDKPEQHAGFCSYK